MDKRIAYYTLAKQGEFWSDAIANRFNKNLSKYGIISFEEGSEEESDFISLCSELKIAVSNKKTLIKCTGKDLYRYPFHYLSVKNDRECYNEESFMDNKDACDGGGRLFCNIGAKQDKKVIIDLKKSKKLDIMIIPNLLRPRIYLISRKLRELTEPMGLSGYRLIPCPEKGKNYSETDMSLETENEQLEKEAAFFQLVITEKVLNPPRAGVITRIFSQCPKCNTVYGFDSDTTPYFYSGDLSATDFQTFSEYIPASGRKFSIPGDIAVISSRVLRVLTENNITGLFRYLTDPPIKYGVVEIREKEGR